jgi:hypothetical protein
MFLSHLENKGNCGYALQKTPTTHVPEQNNIIECCIGHEAAEETSDATLLAIVSLTQM